VSPQTRRGFDVLYWLCLHLSPAAIEVISIICWTAAST